MVNTVPVISNAKTSTSKIHTARVIAFASIRGLLVLNSWGFILPPFGFMKLLSCFCLKSFLLNWILTHAKTLYKCLKVLVFLLFFNLPTINSCLSLFKQLLRQLFWLLKCLNSLFLRVLVDEFYVLISVS